jgi:hypothetical protein
MNEYFTRVDYSSIAFRTPVQSDGALTDRGMIYIFSDRLMIFEDFTKTINCVNNGHIAD